MKFKRMVNLELVGSQEFKVPEDEFWKVTMSGIATINGSRNDYDRDVIDRNTVALGGGALLKCDAPGSSRYGVGVSGAAFTAD